MLSVCTRPASCSTKHKYKFWYSVQLFYLCSVWWHEEKCWSDPSDFWQCLPDTDFSCGWSLIDGFGKLLHGFFSMLVIYTHSCAEKPRQWCFDATVWWHVGLSVCHVWCHTVWWRSLNHNIIVHLLQNEGKQNFAFEVISSCSFVTPWYIKLISVWCFHVFFWLVTDISDVSQKPNTRPDSVHNHQVAQIQIVAVVFTFSLSFTSAKNTFEFKHIL